MHTPTSSRSLVNVTCHRPTQQLWHDQGGFIVSTELILLTTTVIIGLVVGTASVRDSITSEISDVAGSVQDFNQCYSFNGVLGHSGSTHGSDFVDATDHCDDPDDTAGAADNCITFDGGSGGGDIAGGTVTSYSNSDTSTDISASQNSDTLKWELDPGQEDDADAITQAILNCINDGHTAEISWTDADGNTNTFSADSILSDGPSSFAFSGTSSGSASGKLSEATVTCSDGTGGGGIEQEE